MSIPFIDLKAQYNEIKDQVQSQINKVLEHGQYILGPEMLELEDKLATFVGSKHALTCASGTDALVMALMALDIGAGDEVIVPGFSFFATAEVVSLVGAKPIFVDVREKDLNINPELVESHITKNTKAIIVVGLYGQCADMDELSAISKKHNLKLIEDAAQSFGAEYKGKRSCNLADISCTSFFPAKPLGCYGDGGAVFTNDSDLAEVMRQIRMHGEASRYNHQRIGINGRMDTLQCAIMLPKLEKFPWEIEQRQAIANRYFEKLKLLNDFVTPTQIADDRTSVFAQFTMFVENRTELQEFLSKKGIPTAVHYPKPMYKNACFGEEAMNLNLPVCEKAAQKVISLPMHPYLDENTQNLIVDGIKEFYKL